ncbi:MAG TPA: adenylate/guanylate cyclase domain-containing protein, partial [Enterovirga sp.]|nr:adenylate/guanylate cyclase domain-containing protein [Enterovirga sp.]
AAIASWVIKAGLAGAAEPDLLRGFCERLVAAGLPVCRAIVIADTLHPVHEGRVFRWFRDRPEDIEVREYGRTNQGGDTAESWRRSPLFHMLQTNQSAMHRRIDAESAAEFPFFAELLEAGQTDYLALIDRFDAEAAIGEMDCIYSSWSSHVPAGFGDADIAALKFLAPALSLAIKSASLARIAETLVETYLGRDAGRRVLNGGIERGVADRIEAVVWFSDLRGYTEVSDTAPPGDIIPLLNDYAEMVISSVHEAGGDVLKLIGDGTLAIFTAEDSGQACRAALHAEALMRSRIQALNERRAAAGAPITTAYLALNVGEVFYGNVGSKERLDFTVVGPAVNETSRIAAMCRSIERDILLSSAFAAAAPSGDRARLVSVGRYALRGVGRAQELFTLDPETR